jgi:6,7-dimethyl-8-ribityllumazine synthase
MHPACLDMHRPTHTILNAEDLRIGIAVSRYHDPITTSMKDSAVESFVRAGGAHQNLEIVTVPGSFELIAACRALAFNDQEHPLDAIVAIGCIITGETTHDQYLAHSLTQGLTAIIVQTGVPIAFGVLTCQSLEQARARSIDAGACGAVNKGAEAMAAAIETACLIRSLRGEARAR